MDPLVSVLMPCYNSAATLPLALASLRVQTYSNWECVLVDDGSADKPHEVVQQFRDPRIRVIRQSSNLGRGAARQKSVDCARGSLLAMVDADDWIYPEKLKTQVEILASDRSIALVSTAMGIVDRQGRLRGVRGARTSAPMITERYVRGSVVPCAYAPSMYRAEAGAGIRFDSSFRCTEDVDFLSRILNNRVYSILSDVLYVYTEYGSVTPPKMMMATANTARMYLSWRAEFPFRSRWLALSAWARAPLYKAAELLGMWDLILQRRSTPCTDGQRTHFEEAGAIVCEELRRCFGDNAVRACTDAPALSGTGN